jgi:MFS family permease
MGRLGIDLDGMGAWPQSGFRRLLAPMRCTGGLFISTMVMAACSVWSSDEFFHQWGWRIPFLLSIVLIGIGLWVRLGILETPVFQKLVSERNIERAPILEVLKKQPREIILTAFARMSERAPFYILTTFIFAYGTGAIHVARNLVLYAVMVAALVSFTSIPLFGHISDLTGRRRTYIIGAVAVGIFGFIYFGLVDTGTSALVFIAIVLSLIPHDMQYGPQAALIAEAFTPRLRYSGASLGYQRASIIAGGPGPIIARPRYSRAIGPAMRLRVISPSAQ